MTADRPLRLALAQIHAHPGALARNAGLLRAARAEAARRGADAVVTSEFSLTGAPLQALARDHDVLDACEAAIAALAAETADGGPALLLGAPWRDGPVVRNAAWVLDGGQVATRRAQQHATPPFDPGPAPGPVALRGHRLGLMVGADTWDMEVAETLAETGAEVLLALAAPRFAVPDTRIDRAVAAVVGSGLGLACVGLLGGTGGPVRDGAGFVLNPDRRLALQMPGFVPAIALTEWCPSGQGLACTPHPLPPPVGEEERVWQSMMLGLRDAVEIRGCHGVTLDDAGTLGAAVSAAVAVDALGPSAVTLVLPDPQAGRDRAAAAAACAARLGVALERPALRGVLDGLQASLGPGDRPREDRLAALVVAMIAERRGDLLLGTADKAAMAIGAVSPWAGYPAGYSVVQDAFPALLRRLGLWRNAARPGGALGPQGSVIPEALLDPAAPPAAPEAILEALMERRESPAALVAAGHDPTAVRATIDGLRHAEAARRAAPPGLILSASAFGPHWRYPVAHGFREPLPGTGTPTA